MNSWIQYVFSSSVCKKKKWKHHLDFNSDAPPPPRCIIVLFQLFFFFPLPSSSLVVFPPQTALPFGYFSLTPSVSLMQMFSLVTKPRGEFTAWLGSSTLRIATHPSTHLFLCFLSKFSLSPPSSLGFWILNHFPPIFLYSAFSSLGLACFLYETYVLLLWLSSYSSVKKRNNTKLLIYQWCSF